MIQLLQTINYPINSLQRKFENWVHLILMAFIIKGFSMGGGQKFYILKLHVESLWAIKQA